VRSGRALLFALVGAAILIVVLFAAGCGGETTTSTTSAPTTAAPAPTTIQVVTTTSTTAAPPTTTSTTEAGATLDAYRTQMKALWDQYGSKLDTLSSALDSLDLSDPTTVSDTDLRNIEDFTDAVKGYAAGLEPIKPPNDLADPHATYLRVMEKMAAAFDQLVTALNGKKTSELLNAAAALSKVMEDEDAAMTSAQATLEKALGFSLDGDDSSSTTTSLEGLGGDSDSYTDSAFGYTFQYPSGWEIDKSATTDVTVGSSAQSTVAAYDPTGTVADGMYVDLMLVSTYALSDTVTDSMIPDLEGDVQRVLDSFTSQIKDAQVVSPLAQTEAAGLLGYTITYTFAKGGVPLTSTLYFLFQGDLEFEVTIQAASANWDEYQPTFAEMVGSFTTQ
jgi:hypothetical protein